jgi:hypothetical protein
MRTQILSAFLLGAVLALTGCETPARMALPELTFVHLEPLQFAAASVEIIDEYRPALGSPNVESLFSTSPANATRAWVDARISAAGDQGTVRVIIKNAAVVRVGLPVREGLAGVFYNEQNVRYEAVLEVIIEYRSGLFLDSSARIQVMRSRTAPENISIDDRNQLFFELTENLLSDLDTEIVRNIRRYMVDALL